MKAYNTFKNQGFAELYTRSKYYIIKLTQYRKLKFDICTKRNLYLNQLRYYSPPDPTRLIWVDPRNVEYINDTVCRDCGLGQVQGGEWDKNKKKWRNSWKYQGLKERFVQEKHWKDTKYIEHYREKIEKKGIASGCRSIDEFIDKRCEYIDMLYEEMNTNGYACNKNKRRMANPNRIKKEKRVKWMDPYEPFAVISRDGEIQANEGAHRRAIAEFVGIEKIPMNVLLRHKIWQKKRDKLARSESNIERIDVVRAHPDLVDVLT